MARHKKKQAAGLFKHGIHKLFAVTLTQVTFNVLSDTSVTVVECTREKILSAPILMKTVSINSLSVTIYVNIDLSN